LTQKQIIELQSAMLPLQQSARLVRGTGWDQLPEGFRNQTDVQKLIGKTIQDPGFVSTSVAGSGGNFTGTVKLRIEAPAGTPGIFVKKLSLHPGENEFLLAAGTKFRVLEVIKTGHETEIRLRVVTPK
jgi:hypothetical protein